MNSTNTGTSDNDRLTMEIHAIKNILSNEIDSLKNALAEEKQEINELKHARKKDEQEILALKESFLNNNQANDASGKIKSKPADQRQEEVLIKKKKYYKLKSALMRDCGNNTTDNDDTVVLLRSDDPRDYTLEELGKVRRRPFASRLYISGININWNTVWLQTHFSDCHANESPFRRIRDLVKAMIITQNHVASFNNLSDLLTQWFEMKDSKYYSLAATLASAISDYGRGVTFECRADNDREYSYKVLEVKKEELLKKQFTRLMHILFSKIAIERRLVKEGKDNIFRLVYCLTKYMRCKDTDNYGIFKFVGKIFWAYLKAFMSFIIQILLTIYIILSSVQKVRGGEGMEELIQFRMIPLAIVTLVLSSLLSWPELKGAAATFNLYKGVRRYDRNNYLHPLALMDYTANVILPIVLTIAGFFIILIQEDYIDAVLNSTALIFIIEIDDNMPKVLDLDATSIIRNHLITEALIELQEDQKYIQNENSTKKVMESGAKGKKRGLNTKSSFFVSKSRRIAKEEDRLKNKHHIPKIQFSDMLLTNHPEGGTNINDSRIYAPHEILGDPQKPKVIASNFISGDCLFRRIEWSYTTGYPFSSSPRIACIKLWKLDDDDDEPYVMKMPSSKEEEEQQQTIINVPTDDPRENNSNPCSVVLITDPHESVLDPYSKEMKALLDRSKNDLANNHHAIKKELDALNPVYRLEGVYMITTVECSESIFRLRICGSRTVENFISAIETYSLWGLKTSAERKLSIYQRKHNEKDLLDATTTTYDDNDSISSSSSSSSSSFITYLNEEVC